MENYYVPFSARSPNLTCMNFYFWGIIKDMVYTSTPTTRLDMMELLKNAMTTLNSDEVLRAVNVFEMRIKLCTDNDGMHF